MKKIILQECGGGYRVKEVIGDENKENWGKIQGQFIYDYQFNGVKADLRKDKYIITIIR